MAPLSRYTYAAPVRYQHLYYVSREIATHYVRLECWLEKNDARNYMGVLHDEFLHSFTEGDVIGPQVAVLVVELLARLKAMVDSSHYMTAAPPDLPLFLHEYLQNMFDALMRASDRVKRSHQLEYTIFKFSAYRLAPLTAMTKPVATGPPTVEQSLRLFEYIHHVLAPKEQSLRHCQTGPLQAEMLMLELFHDCGPRAMSDGSKDPKSDLLHPLALHCILLNACKMHQWTAVLTYLATQRFIHHYCYLHTGKPVRTRGMPASDVTSIRRGVHVLTDVPLGPPNLVVTDEVDQRAVQGSSQLWIELSVKYSRLSCFLVQDVVLLAACDRYLGERKRYPVSITGCQKDEERESNTWTDELRVFDARRALEDCLALQQGVLDYLSVTSCRDRALEFVVFGSHTQFDALWTHVMPSSDPNVVSLAAPNIAGYPKPMMWWYLTTDTRVRVVEYAIRASSTGSFGFFYALYHALLCSSSLELRRMGSQRIKFAWKEVSLSSKFIQNIILVARSRPSTTEHSVCMPIMVMMALVCLSRLCCSTDQKWIQSCRKLASELDGLVPSEDAIESLDLPRRVGEAVVTMFSKRLREDWCSTAFADQLPLLGQSATWEARCRCYLQNLRSSLFPV